MTLAFIHGWSSNKTIWDRLIAHLPKTIDCRLIDLPGHGGVPDDLDFDAEIDAIEKPVILCGWSLGSLLALDYATGHPDAVAGLILFCPVASFLAREDWPHGMAPETFADFRKRFFRGGKPDFRHFGNLAINGTLEPARWLAALADVHSRLPKASMAGLNWGLDQLRDRAPLDRLDRLDCPTLIIAGQEDLLVSLESCRDLADRLPQATLVELDWVGHLPHLVEAERCAKLIAEWAGHESP